MERFVLSQSQDNMILSRRNYIVNNIIPLAMRIVSKDRFVILFLAGQDNDDVNVLLQIMFSMNERDEAYIKSHPLYMDNLLKNPGKLKIYVDATKEATSENLYMTDFKMTKSDKNFYFLTTAAQKVNDMINVLDLYFTQDNFIKINIFLRRLSIYDRSAELAFLDKKLNHIEFSTVEDIILDASSTDFISKIICNHYTCKNGKQSYKFNFISPKIAGRKLKKPMNADKYSSLYMDDFVISDMIFFDNKLYIIYEDRSSVTNEYKKTIAIILNEKLYSKTNLIDFSNNYEKED